MFLIYLPEFLDPFQHFLVFVIGQVLIVISGMPRIEGMEPNHVQSFLIHRLKTYQTVLILIRSYRIKLKSHTSGRVAP